MVRIGNKGLTESQYQGRNASTGWHQCAERPSKQSSETSGVWRPQGSGYWFGDQAALT